MIIDLKGADMTTVHWDPAKDLMSLRDAMNKLFEEGVVKPSGFTFEIGTAGIPFDMYETQNEIVIKAQLPGVKPEEADISITEDILTIKAEKKEPEAAKDRNYLRKENRYGSLSRSINLPAEVKAEMTNAVFENGMLTLNLPKAETAKPKHIKVQVKTSSGEGGSY
jgi:HSP20 family protein